MLQNGKIAEGRTGMGDAAQVKNEIVNGYASVKNERIPYFSIKVGKYLVAVEKDYSMWCVSVYDDEMPKNGMYFSDEACLLDRRAANVDGNGECRRWSNAVVDEIVHLIMVTIGNDSPDGWNVDDVIDGWLEKHPNEHETIDSVVFNENGNGCIDVWIGGLFFQSEIIERPEDVTDFMDNLRYEIGTVLECGVIEADDYAEDAIPQAIRYEKIAEAWGLEWEFGYEELLGEWAEKNIYDIVGGFKIPICIEGDKYFYEYPVDDFNEDVWNFLYDFVWRYAENLPSGMLGNVGLVVDILFEKWDLDYDAALRSIGYEYDSVDGIMTSLDIASEIDGYCENYGYDWIMADGYPMLNLADEDFLLLPMLGECPDDFYERFGDGAGWDYTAMYRGMAGALSEIGGRRWRVECDGYRVYGYLIDDAA